MSRTGSESAGKTEARVLFACWLVLLALTAGSFWSAEDGTMQGIDASRLTVALVLGIAAIKAQLIAGVFMELHRAPRGWAVAMAGFILSLTGVLILIWTW